ncbi:MAG: hypothetical protein IKZ04_06485 [Spirochaetaceae bacterium]|nr:hypothetical protein [Spirochaetaceae bacterium]
MKAAAVTDIEYMKMFFKVTAVFFLFFIPSVLFASDENINIEDVPELLHGVWQNDSRIVVFEQKPSMDIVLKLFYGWYYDRTAEPEENVPARPRNDATSIKAQVVTVSFEPIIPESNVSGAWNVVLFYPDFNKTVVVPVAVFNQKLYTDFNILIENENHQVFQAASNASGITVNLPSFSENIYSYYQADENMYKIRYWQTDMDYDSETLAEFKIENENFFVKKHLKVGQTVYTCVPGKGTVIRNVEKISRDLFSFELSPDKRICVNSDCYLSLSQIKADELYEEIKTENSRQRPPRKPLLPPPDVDFHYEQIKDLRKNAIIPLS